MKHIDTAVFDAQPEGIGEILDYLESGLRALGTDDKTCAKSRFTLEDILTELIGKSSGDSTVRVSVREFPGSVSIRLSCRGSAFDYRESLNELFTGDIDEEAEAIIRSNLLNKYRKDIRVSNKSGINVINFTVTRRKRNRIMISVLSMLTGLLCGFLMKMFLPDKTASFFAVSVFGTGTSLFLRAIKMVIAFLVFFSISSSLAGFRDLRELGRIFVRVLTLFALTSIATILITYSICNIMPIGNESLRATADSSLKYDTMEGVSSLSDIFLNIIPDNFLGAFINSDMMQLLFIAILTGTAASMMGRNSQKICDILLVMDELFEKIILIIVKFMPVCIFCSMASMIIKIDPLQLRQVAVWMGQVYLCDLAVILMLLTMVTVFGGTSPLSFLKQLGQVMISSYSMASSNAVMPMTIQTCREKLNISPKIYSFSIPLGIVINMDGGCVTMLVSTFFLARIYGISITKEMLLPFFISVFMLSVAAPAVPGGILLCLTVLLPQVGIPVEGISIIIGLYFMVAMVQTMTNVTSTVACSYVADRIEKRKEQGRVYE